MNPSRDPITYKDGMKLPRVSRKTKYLLRLFNMGFRSVRRQLLKSLNLPPNADLRKGIHFTSGQVFCEGQAALSDTFFVDYAPIYIGEGAGFSFKNTVVTSTHDPADRDVVVVKPVIIERNAWITTNVTILGGVCIGENSIIGAGSVVTKDIPPNVFAAGNPCKPIKPIVPKTDASS
ncbi:MAG: hypothetical protein JXR40_00400 [Pontiellaceae bacterium]|nr:hypothetical protein [Pontiellaceae bacterium]